MENSMFNVKNFFFKKICLMFLKKKVQIIYNTRLRFSIFTNFGFYSFYCGNRFIKINTTYVLRGNKFSQCVFTKKPFCGPLKKIKF